jgi:hypothetical protein
MLLVKWHTVKSKFHLMGLWTERERESKRGREREGIKREREGERDTMTRILDTAVLNYMMEDGGQQ